MFGSTLIVFSCVGYSAERVSFGILFFLASVFHFVEFFNHFKNRPSRYIFLGLGFAGIVLGIISVAGVNIDLSTVCLIFGIMDATSGLLEICAHSIFLKMSIKTPLNFVEYAISAADIFFGIILIIKLEEGLLVHVLYLAIVFLANGIIALLETVKEIRLHE